MNTEGLNFTNDYTNSFEFVVNPPEHCYLAAPLEGKVHGYKGGFVNLKLGTRCVDITIDELKQIINRWEKKKIIEKSI